MVTASLAPVLYTLDGLSRHKLLSFLAPAYGLSTRNYVSNYPLETMSLMKDELLRNVTPCSVIL